MEIILSAAIGGEITADCDGGKTIHSSIIKMRASLKEGFKKIFFEGLNRIKINLYIGGDVSAYCDKTSITVTRYSHTKKECAAELCIDKNYWTSEPVLPIKKKFILFIEKSLISLGEIIGKKLKAVGCDFDCKLFKETVIKSLAEEQKKL
ncbi:Imm12 family immunity protein [Treponema pedis]|uniref:Immunity protein 12 n=1 Tax=Treponema pedis TaxID=409322 RepID=A0A7S6WQ53_9SPIR|nr:Imm12 family immunity protein [Treponema pedis]QOW61278.1 immunity protein 12 [Treponema pedis]